MLQSARISDPGDAARADAWHGVRAHAVCAPRLVLLVPVAVCVAVAWIAATALSLPWLVHAALSRRGGTMAD